MSNVGDAQAATTGRFRPLPLSVVTCLLAIGFTISAFGADPPDAATVASTKTPMRQNGPTVATKSTVDRAAQIAFENRMLPLHKLDLHARAAFEDGDMASVQKDVEAGFRFANVEAAPADKGFALQEAHFYFDDLLGKMYLALGQNEKALRIFIPPQSRRYFSHHPFSLDIALAYAQEGNYKEAVQFYSDKSLPHITSAIKDTSELPGTGDLRSLTASIHLSRGIDDYCHDWRKRAEKELALARKLAPDNAFVAYFYGNCLAANGKSGEAVTAFRAAQKHGSARVTERAKEEEQRAEWQWHQMHGDNP